MLWFDRAGLDESRYAALRAAVGARRPRVLAWAPGADGDAVVALPDRIAVERGGAWALTGWHEIRTGGWDHRSDTLRWTTAAGEDAVRLSEPGQLPEVFRERVQASIVLQRHVDIPGAPRGATVTARRDPGDPRAELSWVVLPGRGTDPADPVAAAAMADALAAARAEYDLG